MKLIAITGYKLSGKSTVAEELRKMFMPATSRHINFADAVKDEVCQRFCITRDYLESHKGNYRLILQGVGTDIGRKLRGETYWIHKWLETLNGLNPVPQLVVCSDLRFKNEAECVRQLGGTLIRVYRTGTNSDGHASETELDQIKPDFTVQNDGTIDELRKQLQNLNLK